MIHNNRSWICYDKATGAVISTVAGTGIEPPADSPYGWLEGSLPPGNWQIDLNTLQVTAATPPTDPWWMLRQREYPSTADFADAFYWAQQGDPSKMNDYLAKIGAVKKKYPKPTI